MAFIARDGTGGGQLTVVDTSAPTNPFQIADRQGGVDLVRDGNALYMPNRSTDPVAGLHIFDVSDPANPAPLSQFPTRRAYGIAVRNNLAFLVAMDPANGGRGTVFVLDVSDPGAPSLLTKTVVENTTTTMTSALVDGNTLYITTAANGVVILELSGLPGSGDLNCDGRLDGADIDPFFLALGDPPAYAVAFPNCDPLNGDMNGDGRLDGADIDPFFECLGGGACP